jgi:glycosyltransferase involved in cell wall biosynthesis
MKGRCMQQRWVVAVVVPCHDEELTVGTVVRDFLTQLPGATVFVIDNASGDGTARVAAENGARVIHEPRPGKGHAVRRAFAEIEADVYVMVDGDATYDASAAPQMVAMLLEQRLDYVNGRRSYDDPSGQRPGHVLGNRMLARAVSSIFRHPVGDLLSGYKALSRRFVKSFPVTSTGFEIETELGVHALQLQVPSAEHPSRYSDRPEDSVSKLRTFRDGRRILRTILRLALRERPLAVLGAASGLLIALALVVGLPVVVEFRSTGLVERFPTAILATGLAILAMLSAATGLILDAVQHARHETKRLAYLAVPGPSAD